MNYTLKELMRMGFKSNKTYKFKIPNMECIDYPKRDYKIDPYVIGAFLGDGCCKERILTISSATAEIPNYICQLTGFTTKKSSEHNYSWSFYLPQPEIIIKNNHKYTKLHPQTKEFLPPEVCKESKDKSIPSIYKYGSKAQRYALLQGLLDTDGSISYSSKRYNVRFTSLSYQLILDVKEVLNSLGYQSITITKDERNKYKTGTIYGLNINIPNEDKPLLFRLTRKHNLALEAAKTPKKRDYNKVSICSAEDMGYKTFMTCIMVDDPEHLYITNDYIVTHNTTLVSFIVDALTQFNIDPHNDICFCSYTGKAALVLQQKGNENAKTLHKLLYESHPLPDGTFIHIPVKSISYKVVIVDECSMMPKDMMEQLLSYGVYCIFCGDPMQLPPVDKSSDNGLLKHPHIFLDEIMRQAAESEIIQLSMTIREGRPIKPFQGKEAVVMPRSHFNTGVMLWGDQLLCATNKTRITLNLQMRQLLGRSNEPESGDRLICLRNYDNISNDGDILVNGVTGIVRNCYQSFIQIPRWLRSDKDRIFTLEGEFISDSGDSYGNLIMDYQEITTGERCLDNQVLFKLGRNKRTRHLIPLEFSYGYCITVWKAQGSEWDKVVLLEEGFPFDKKEHQQYLYTGITRAREKGVLVIE